MHNCPFVLVASAALALWFAPFAFLVVPHAQAQRANVAPVTRLGTSGLWEAYEDDAPGGKICFLVGRPKKIDRSHTNPDQVRMSVTHRPADKVANVVNFILGYRARTDSDAVLVVDGRKFPLFTDKDGAWTRDASTDRAVVIAMSHGKKALIKAEPEHGKTTADSYDLNGFKVALQMIDRACGVKR
jgi:hypothetical protein